MQKSRLAVCSWSLQPANPEELLAAIREIGVPSIQCALDPIRENPSVWGNFKQQCDAEGVSIVSGMFGTIGEDYTTMESIKRTGGVLPDNHWSENRKNIQANAELAARMGLNLVTFHAGFLPHDTKDPVYQKVKARISELADLFAAHNIVLAFETGQETAETLGEFLVDLAKPNVGVNFDPANMILYEKGDPIQALRTLGKWIRQCHIKDARKTKVTGTWGEEVVVGTGEVNWPQFFKTLDEIQFAGALCIEREAGNSRIADIKEAARFVEKL